MTSIYINSFGKVKFDKNGNWLHKNQPFLHKKTIETFNKNLTKKLDGSFFVKFNNTELEVEVEDFAFWVIDSYINLKNSKISFLLSNQKKITINKTSQNAFFTINLENELYFSYKKIKSKLSKPVYNEIIKYLYFEDNIYNISINQLKIKILQSK